MKKVVSLIGLALFSFGFGSTALAQYYPPASFFLPASHLTRAGSNDIISWLENQDFETFAFLLGMAGLDEQLNLQENTITLFAPTDTAFAKLPADVREKLSRREELERLLKYHLVTKTITEADIKNREIATVEGSTLQITGDKLSDGTLEIKLNEAVAETSFGLNEKVIIIFIDEVLLPPDF